MYIFNFLQNIDIIFRKEFGGGKELQLYLITQTGIILNQTIAMEVKIVYNFWDHIMVSNGMTSPAAIILVIIQNHFVKNLDKILA